MLSLNDFVAKFPDLRYNALPFIPCFDFLIDPKIIAHMLYNNFQCKPALEGLAPILMGHFRNCPIFPLDVPSNRACVGKMIRYIQEQYGFTPVCVGKIKGDDFKQCMIYG